MATREQRKRRRVQLALAAVVATAAGLVGFGLWWEDHRAAARRRQEGVRAAVEQARSERDAEAVTALLDLAEQALVANNVSKAATALDAADRRMADGGADAGRDRLARLRDDLAVVKELDAAVRFAWTPTAASYPDGELIARRYRDLLARFTPADTPAGRVADRVSRSAVRVRLIEALDHVLVMEGAERVRAVLAATDPNPFRDAVRDAIRDRDDRAVAELAGRAEAVAQPPEFAILLGGHPAVPLRRRREILTTSVHRQPTDLGLLMTLGRSYPFNQKDGADERVRWYQAAAAVAPTNPAVHNLLGSALLDQGDRAAAVMAFWEALRHAPDDHIVMGNLGNALTAGGNPGEAVTVLREALRLAPDYAPARGT